MKIICANVVILAMIAACAVRFTRWILFQFCFALK